jgi:uncharacterized protein (UPF0335 family)
LAGIKRDDDGLRVGDVGIGFDLEVLKNVNATTRQRDANDQDQQTLLQSEMQ